MVFLKEIFEKKKMKKKIRHVLKKLQTTKKCHLPLFFGSNLDPGQTEAIFQKPSHIILYSTEQWPHWCLSYQHVWCNIWWRKKCSEISNLTDTAIIDVCSVLWQGEKFQTNFYSSYTHFTIQPITMLDSITCSTYWNFKPMKLHITTITILAPSEHQPMKCLLWYRSSHNQNWKANWYNVILNS